MVHWYSMVKEVTTNFSWDNFKRELCWNYGSLLEWWLYYWNGGYTIEKVAHYWNDGYTIGTIEIVAIIFLYKLISSSFVIIPSHPTHPTHL